MGDDDNNNNNNLRENLSMPSSTDPEPTHCFGSVLTRTNSDSSAITLDSSKDVLLRCDNAIPGKSTEWTDEKHSMYLDSLESSFVDELYNSKRYGGWGMEKNSWKSHYSDQFVVLGDGCWKKIKYENKEPLLDSTAESRLVMESPRIRQFTNSGKRRSVAWPDPQGYVAVYSNGLHLRGKLTCLCRSARGSEHNPVCDKCHQDLVDAEVSDENFVENNYGRKPSCKSTVKRLKTAARDDSTNDQIVPSKKFHAADVSTIL